jgi:hypothetical protein
MLPLLLIANKSSYLNAHTLFRHSRHPSAILRGSNAISG